MTSTRADDAPALVPPAGAALTPLQAGDAMLRAALAVSTVEGEGVFRGLVDSLAQILGTDLAFIALPVPDNPALLRMLAFHLDGRTVENFAYPLAGTPCATVIGQCYRVYPERVTQLFPLDNDFARLGLQAYAGHPLTDAHGAPLGIISVVSRRSLPDAGLVESMLKIFAARAVTEIERTRADAALRTAEASYRAIFESAEDSIFVHDWDTGAVLDANACACATYGYTREELRTITVDAISSGVPPFTAVEARNWIERARRDGHVEFEWHRRSRDGSLHWDEVRLKSAVIGGERRILAFARDITQRKGAEEALRNREEQYRAIFDGSADAMVLWSRDIRIVDVNAAFTQMYGYTRDEVLGGTFGDRIPRDGVARRIAMIEGALAGHGGQLEETAVRKDGDRFASELRYVPILYRGEPHVLAIARDITERKRAESQRTQLEAQLRQAQKMEAIGQLTGGIAHDFNNILTSILGYAVLASERAQQTGDDIQTRHLEHVQRSALRARDVIAQMLTFSRGRRGDPRPLALAGQVREALSLLRSTLPATIALESDLPASLPVVHADPVQVEQVLLNLCINARDAIAGSGRIDVALRAVNHNGTVCASCQRPVSGRHVELLVTDSGSGIAPAVMERMFEPFYTTKAVGKGSGMGLSTVHGIVHEHGGHVVVDTGSGGSTFRVLLPVVPGGVADATTADGARGTPAAARRLTGRVLVIDDEPMIADFMREMLLQWGIAVTAMTDALDAERWFGSHSAEVDLVITDQSMPHRTGLLLARTFALARPELPVVLFTGYGDDLTADVLARHGVAALLRKPVAPDELFAVLQQHLPLH